MRSLRPWWWRLEGLGRTLWPTREQAYPNVVLPMEGQSAWAMVAALPPVITTPRNVTREVSRHYSRGGDAVMCIYRGQLFRQGDDLNVCRLLHPDTGDEVYVTDFGDPDLIIDPTYSDVLEAERRVAQAQEDQEEL